MHTGQGLNSDMVRLTGRRLCEVLSSASDTASMIAVLVETLWRTGAVASVEGMHAVEQLASDDTVTGTMAVNIYAYTRYGYA